MILVTAIKEPDLAAGSTSTRTILLSLQQILAAQRGTYYITELADLDGPVMTGNLHEVGTSLWGCLVLNLWGQPEIARTVQDAEVILDGVVLGKSQRSAWNADSSNRNVIAHGTLNVLRLHFTPQPLQALTAHYGTREGSEAHLKVRLTLTS